MPTDEYVRVIQESSDLSTLFDPVSPLLIERSEWRGKQIEVSYAPFEHVEQSARIVIVGLTPGRQQAERAIASFAAALHRGETIEAALRIAKSHASFAGTMRRNLVRMLDALDVTTLLNVRTSEDLWEEGLRMAHFTSLVRFPVFVDGSNWSGSPDPVQHATIRRWMESWTGIELQSLDPIVIIPLGPVATRGLDHLAKTGAIDGGLILRGLPHPSGANAERISCFLGDKPAQLASHKTDGHALVAARERLRHQVAALVSRVNSRPRTRG